MPYTRVTVDCYIVYRDGVEVERFSSMDIANTYVYTCESAHSAEYTIVKKRVKNPNVYRVYHVMSIDDGIIWATQPTVARIERELQRYRNLASRTEFKVVSKVYQVDK